MAELFAVRALKNTPEARLDVTGVVEIGPPDPTVRVGLGVFVTGGEIDVMMVVTLLLAVVAPDADADADADDAGTGIADVLSVDDDAGSESWSTTMA